VVNNLAKMLRRVLGEDVSLRLQVAPSLPLIFADANMLDQVLLNLAVNSRDAMPNGGQLTIEVFAQAIDAVASRPSPDAKTGQYVCLRVTDSGSGIAPEDLPHIFEPFFTTKVVGKGTGLGLATVYGIVRQHQGWLQVESQVGLGTTFQIFLPCAGPHAKVPAAAAVQPKLCAGTECILLVEDDEAVRLLLRNLLEERGYRILDAGNGQAALALWQLHREQVQLLLTDVVLPGGISGVNLGERLKAEKTSLKIIFTSGHGADALAGAGMRFEEGKNFLTKPYSPQRLAETIRECLDVPL
jgi:CheY-like chemotaxis protein